MSTRNVKCQNPIFNGELGVFLHKKFPKKLHHVFGYPPSLDKLAPTK